MTSRPTPLKFCQLFVWFILILMRLRFCWLVNRLRCANAVIIVKRGKIKSLFLFFAFFNCLTLKMCEIKRYVTQCQTQN